jgi:hypothetical protein
MRRTGVSLAVAAVISACAQPVVEVGEPTSHIFDSSGRTYPLSGEIPVLPLSPPYGFSFQLGGIVLTQADLTTQGPDGAVRVYAAPRHVEDCEGLPEGDEANRVQARVEATGDGGLVAQVDEQLPEGSQLVFTLAYGALLRDHYPLPILAPCSSAQECALSGYTARLYVGSQPQPPDPPGLCRKQTVID